MVATLVTFLAGAVLGTAFGVALGFFLFPFVFPPPPAAEQLTDDRPRQRRPRRGHVHPRQPERSHSLGQGQRVGARGQRVPGRATSRSGPARSSTSIWCPKAQIRASGDLAGQMFVDLGRLRAFKGSQRYAIPAGLDLAKYQSVIIWCEQFSVLISPADLTAQAADRLHATTRRPLYRQQGREGCMTRTTGYQRVIVRRAGRYDRRMRLATVPGQRTRSGPA